MNDSDILSKLTQYADLSDQEIDDHIESIEDNRNVDVGYAIVGRIDPDQLDPDLQAVYSQVTTLPENPQVSRIVKLRREGRISNDFMLLYGMHGDLPDRDHYYSLSPEEKHAFWERRFRSRLGENWRDLFDYLPPFLRDWNSWIDQFEFVDWKEQGF